MAETGTSDKKVRFIKPPNILKDKVGSGGIDESLLEKSQDYIEKAELDFIPFAKAYLKEFSLRIKKFDNKSNDNFQNARDEVAAPVMQLKANGGMFQYQLVSDVADIALQFLDAIDQANADAVAVLKAHENTLKVIINSGLKGDGGREGYALVKELDQACRRYFSKYKKKT